MLVEFANSDVSDDDFLFEEFEILLKSGVQWFAQDWKCWDIKDDEGAIDQLDWVRTVIELPDGSYRVEIRQRPKRKKRLRKGTTAKKERRS
jgi:hypothetical protein